jgi:biopolymer transport protein TolR
MQVSGGSGRGRRRKHMAEINVVPYIDVSLVLLIIFMVTAPMLQTGVEVELPPAEGQPVDSTGDSPIIVSMDKDEKLYLDTANQGDKPVTEAELTARVAEALAKKPGAPVLLRADKSLDYGRVMRIAAAITDAGVPKLGFITGSADE